VIAAVAAMERSLTVDLIRANDMRMTAVPE
jgi:hypothetical protein